MTAAQDKRDKGFAAIVERAIYDLHVEQGYVAPKDGPTIARAIIDKLHADGLAIHDPDGCLRGRTWQQRQAIHELHEPAGRDMTVGEQIAFGFVVPSDDVP